MLSASIKVGNDEFNFRELPAETMAVDQTDERATVGPTRIVVLAGWDRIGSYTPGSDTLDDVEAPFNELPPEAIGMLALAASSVVVAWDLVGQSADHTRRHGRDVAAQMRAQLDQLDAERSR